ncbi:dihydroxy-acid dehydratase (plasmid) [Rhizobium leguminosarum]|nr:dihydroxy-acid dehydratase [Rhizobium leguminosarum]UIK14651.1 dihydroxy-acid dehydratase [Rhizobium leguminosarum]
MNGKLRSDFEPGTTRWAVRRASGSPWAPRRIENRRRQLVRRTFRLLPAPRQVMPEAAEGGPLALVRDGEEIEIDLNARRVTIDAADEELADRRRYWIAPAAPIRFGWLTLYQQLVQPLSKGAVLGQRDR